MIVHPTPRLSFVSLRSKRTKVLFSIKALALVAFSCLSGCGGCSESEELMAVPFALEKVSGDWQEGLANDVLPDELVVRVVDEDGAGVEGHAVVFAISSAPEGARGHSISWAATLTDSEGEASVVLTLGGEPGDYEVTAAAADDLAGSPLTFTASALEDEGLLEEISGGGQTAVVTETLPEAFVVGLRDEDGGPVEGATVIFEITAAPAGATSHGLSATSVTTDHEGLASTTLTLGTRAGEYEVKAEVEGELGFGRVTFTAGAIAGEAFSLEVASGDGQSQVVTRALENDLAARVVDEHGNPVGGHEVAFAVLQVPEGAGGHSLSDAQAETGTSGIASTSLVLGTKAGAYSVEATATPHLEGSPAIFVAIAVAGQAASLELVSGDGQTGTVRQELDRPLLARALDEHGNVVRGHEVAFAIEDVPDGAAGEALSEPSVTTGPGGLAETRLTLGTLAGAYAVRATAPGSLADGSVLFTATAQAGEPTDMIPVSGEGQTAEVNTKLSLPMTVRLTDEFGNPVVGHPLNFVIDGAPQDAAGQSLTVTSTFAGSTGEASTVLTLGNRPGSYQVSATASGTLSDSPAVFVAEAFPGEAYAIERASSETSFGTVMQDLPEELAVRVLDRAGNGVPGQSVSFFVDEEAGGGWSFGDDAPSTDGEGIAATTFRPGTKAGTYVVRAGEEGELVGAPVFFSVEAGSGEPFALRKISGCGETAEVTMKMPEPFVVRVEDEHENPIAGHEVGFSITTVPDEATGQRLVDTVSVTNEDGLAETTLELGTRAGLYEVEAVSDEGLPGEAAVFQANAVGGDAVTLLRVSEEHQDGVVAEEMEEMVVRVIDSVGNGTAFFPVTFEVHSAPEGSGPTWIERSSETDLEGYARAVLKLGSKAGDYEIRVSTETSLSGSPMSFFATAHAGAPYAIEVDVSPWENVRPGQLLDLSLRVVDELENTVEDWTGLIDVNLPTDPWGAAPIAVEVVDDDGGEVALPESISFSVADEEHLVSVSAQDLTGLSLPVEVLRGELVDPRVQQETYGISEVGGVSYSFALQSHWPPDGSIEIVMPEGYDLSLATLESVSGAPGDFSLGVTGGRTALVSRSNHEDWVDAGTEIKVELGGVENPPHGAEGRVDISTLTADGRVVDAGLFYLRVWLRTASGGRHTCGIDTEGRLWCWGRNFHGQLGNGTRDDTLLPVEVGGGHTDWVAVTAGWEHTCGLREAPGGDEGNLYCWGRGGSGQLGVGSYPVRRTTPSPVVGEHSDWLEVSAGAHHTCGRRQGGGSGEGSLWCWGSGSNGRLGHGSTSSSPEPELVGEHDDWLHVSAGGRHSCGIRASGSPGTGTMWCWGWATYGQVGHGSPDEVHEPVEVLGSDDDWLRVSAGEDHSCGVRAADPEAGGTLWCWGRGADGRLGYGDTNNRIGPDPVAGGYTDWMNVSAANEHTCGMRLAGGGDRATAWCWGSGDDGRLGNFDFVEQLVPVEVHGNDDRWVDLSSGDRHTCGVRALGTGDGGILDCWGSNDDGRLGLGLEQKDQYYPVGLDTTMSLATISAGLNHGCAIGEDKSLWCWGLGTFGRLGTGDLHRRATPWLVVGGLEAWLDVSAGGHHTCGIKEAGEEGSGTVWCWGRGSYGRLGTGASSDEHEPVQVASAEDGWTSVSVGPEHGCAILASDEPEGGSLWCWGRGFRGRLGTGSTSSESTPAPVDGEHEDWLRVSAGGNHTCGIRGAGPGGRLYCWGFNGNGQLGDGTNEMSSSPVAVEGQHDDWMWVSAGSEHTCGVRASGPGEERTLWCWGNASGGRLGNTGTEDRLVPTLVFGGHTDWRKVAAGTEHTCGIRATGVEGGSLYCWGNGGSGRLGSGDDSWVVPHPVAGDHDDWLLVSAGNLHTYGLRTGGSWSWGANLHVQLGDGTAEKAEPYRVENPDPAASTEE